MGDALRPVTRRTDMGERSSSNVLSKTLGVKNDTSKKKDPIKEDLLKKFEESIREQSEEVSKETDKIFKASAGGKKIISSETKPISKKENTIQRNKEESLSDVLSDLNDILSNPERVVSTKAKVFFKEVDLTSVPDKIEECENTVLAVKVPPSQDTELNLDCSTKTVTESPAYFYGGLPKSDFKVGVLPKKKFVVSLSLDSPKYLSLYEAYNTRVICLEDHPLRDKVLKMVEERIETLGELQSLDIGVNSFNFILFGDALREVYKKKKGYFLFESPIMRIQSKDYKAKLILTDIVLDYPGNFYYIILELEENNTSAKIHNVILINSDVIFSI